MIKEFEKLDFVHWTLLGETIMWRFGTDKINHLSIPQEQRIKRLALREILKRLI